MGNGVTPREIRLAAGLSQAKIAKATGKSLFSVARYEAGKRTSDLTRARLDPFYAKLAKANSEQMGSE